MKPIRVLLADDLMLIRHGIRALLSSVEDVDIVGEVSTADDAVRLARELVPDVVLMDQDMPGDGLAATRSIKEEIAAKCVVAEGTVKTHIRHILRKLGARNRTQAVAYVLRKGVIQ